MVRVYYEARSGSKHSDFLTVSSAELEEVASWGKDHESR